MVVTHEGLVCNTRPNIVLNGSSKWAFTMDVFLDEDLLKYTLNILWAGKMHMLRTALQSTCNRK
jgi:hypothetical protein